MSAAVGLAVPAVTVAIYRLPRAGRRDEAVATHRWSRPLLDLDVRTSLMRIVEFAEMLATGSNGRLRAPRMPLSGERRRAAGKVVGDAMASRPELPVQRG